MSVGLHVHMSQHGSNYPYGYKPIRVTNQGNDKQGPRKAGVKPSGKSYKVLLIGESGVGKSTLIGRLCEDKFLTELRKYTLGFDMFEKEYEIDGEKIRIYIWDTVGTENYDSITTQYYRGAAGIIVVYDITALQSFEQLKKWMNYIHAHATADVNVMLLGAKQDLESKREIEFEDGKKFAATHEISHFYEVSAKTGYNVSEAFFTFFQDVHRKAQGTVQEAAPQPPTPTQSSCCGR